MAKKKAAKKKCAKCGVKIQPLGDRVVVQREEAQLVTAILAKPILALPQDLMVIADCKKSTAYKLAQHPDFPATFTIARQTFVKTEDFMAAMPRIGKLAAK